MVTNVRTTVVVSAFVPTEHHLHDAWGDPPADPDDNENLQEELKRREYRSRSDVNDPRTREERFEAIRLASRRWAEALAEHEGTSRAKSFYEFVTSYRDWLELSGDDLVGYDPLDDIRDDLLRDESAPIKDRALYQYLRDAVPGNCEYLVDHFWCSWIARKAVRR
jgi:hypothetical protein